MQRILIIEDDPAFMKKLLRQMQSIGHCVTIVFGGSLAQEIFLKGFYDLIIIDTDLSDKPGTEVIRQIRKLSGDIPIFVLTREQSQSHILDAIDSGASAYYFKNDPQYFSKLSLSISKCKNIWPTTVAVGLK